MRRTAGGGSGTAGDGSGTAGGEASSTAAGPATAGNEKAPGGNGPAGLQRTLLRHRRTIAMVGAGLLALFVFIRPTSAGDGRVLVAARDLTPGERITETDVTYAAWPLAAVPTAALATADAVGRTPRIALAKGTPVLREFISTPQGLPTVTVKLARRASDVRVGDAVRVWAKYGYDDAELAASYAVVDAIVDSGDEFSEKAMFAVLQIDPADEAALAGADTVVLVRQP